MLRFAVTLLVFLLQFIWHAKAVESRQTAFRNSLALPPVSFPSCLLSISSEDGRCNFLETLPIDNHKTYKQYLCMFLFVGKSTSGVQGKRVDFVCELGGSLVVRLPSLLRFPRSPTRSKLSLHMKPIALHHLKLGPQNQKDRKPDWYTSFILETLYGKDICASVATPERPTKIKRCCIKIA